MISSELRILSLEDAQLWCTAWRRRDLKIGFTNGCFDVLHIGHLALLDFTLRKCDRLIVGINTDASIRRLKGRNRPVNPEVDRALLVASFSMVDAVVLFEDDTPIRLIKALEPDILFKGADYKMENIVGADIVKEVIRCPIVPNKSTTKTLMRVVK